MKVNLLYILGAMLLSTIPLCWYLLLRMPFGCCCLSYRLHCLLAWSSWCPGPGDRVSVHGCELRAAIELLIFGYIFRKRSELAFLESWSVSFRNQCSYGRNFLEYGFLLIF